MTVEGWPAPQNDVALERAIVRGNLGFRVMDGAQTSHWSFWDLWANGGWESGTLSALDEVMPARGLLWDVGAWVGPISLWAAVRHLADVIALEPDPDAFAVLSENVRLNGADKGEAKITALPFALTTAPGPLTLCTVTPGDSLTSMTRVDMLGPKVETFGIDAATLVKIADCWPDVVKMDIEGGESLVLPTLGPKLRERNIPLILALHPNWYADGTHSALAAELGAWKEMRPLGGETYLLRA